MSISTRFAPSPTGYLHIGSARTALYCWLFAQKSQGKFILRIEDTDRERSTQEAVDVILEGMRWMELNWDEGPVYQTQRFERYQEIIEQLLAKKLAYKCYCSKERLQTLRENQMAQKIKPKYDGHCRELEENASPSEEYVIRFKNPQTGSVIIDDAIRGRIEIKNEELDDLIIARSDQTPTYNLTVVVDDWDMGITHVIRGDDHINNTPRQINILKALGATPPIYGHMPMILGEDGKRLSKRHGAVSVLEFRKKGILACALLNYLVRLGWSHGDQEIFSRQEMIDLFSLEGINVSPATFDYEKLLWVNQHYLKTLPVEDILPALRQHYLDLGMDTQKGPALEDVVVALRDRCKTLVELVDNSRPFFESDMEYQPRAAQKHLKESSLGPLESFLDTLTALKQWTKADIKQALQEVCELQNIKLPKIAQPVRVAVTGDTISPSIDLTLWLMGRTKSLQRIQNAISFIKEHNKA